MRIPRLMNSGAGRWRTVARAPEIRPQEVLMRPSVSRIPTVVVGIDTADGDRGDRLLDEGRMPRLAGLLARGRRGHVEPWPPGFYDMV